MNDIKESTEVAEWRIIPSLADSMTQEKAFTEEECEKILSYRAKWKRSDGKLLNSFDFTVNSDTDQKVMKGVDDLEYRRTTVYIPRERESAEWLINKITEIVGAANSLRDYAWKFDIRGMLEPPNIMEYTEGSLHESGIDGHYRLHIDLGGEGPSLLRKISYSVILNESYEGGKLNIKTTEGDYYPPQKTGDIIMFPSYILHCVEPVTKGTRCAVVGWIHGPSFL